MKLWLMKADPSRVGWDHYLGFVVRADTEEEARHLANMEASEDVWSAAGWCECVHIGDGEGEACVLLDSFKAG
jgi:hypothetical protein